MPDESGLPSDGVGQILSRRQRVINAAKVGFRKDAVWPVMIGSACFALALIVEYVEKLLEVKAAAATELTKGQLAQIFTSYIVSSHTLVVVLTDLGSAFVVAWVVSVAIEAQSRHRQEKENTAYRDAIAQDVFEAVYGLRHDTDYIRSAIDGVLSAHFIREDFEVSYRLSILPLKDAQKAGVEPGRFMRLVATTTYTVRNTTASREKWSMTYSIPTRSGHLANLAGVKILEIGERSGKDAYRSEEIDALVDPSRSHFMRAYVLSAEVPPRSAIRVRIVAEMVKEVSDSESMGLKLPTMGAKVRLIIDEQAPKVVFGLNAYTGAAFRPGPSMDTEQRSGEWIIEGPMLPWNSLLLWWRTPADDGSGQNTAKAVKADKSPIKEEGKLGTKATPKKLDRALDERARTDSPVGAKKPVERQKRSTGALGQRARTKKPDQ